MKLLLQRTLSSHWDGPFRVEEAGWNEAGLAGYLPVRKGSQSDFEPRYDGHGILHYLSDWPEPISLYRRPHELVEGGPIFKFAFDGQGRRACLTSQDDGPWGLRVEGGAPEYFPASLTHLVGLPEGGWLFSSLERLYRGQAGGWEDLGAAEFRRFCRGEDGQIYFCLNRQLYSQQPGSSQRQLWFEVDEGYLSFPLWTPRGVLVSQDDPSRLWWVPRPQQATSLWQGREERLYVCDWASD